MLALTWPREGVRIVRMMNVKEAYLLELVKVGFALILPELGNVLRQAKWLDRLPVFDKARLIR